MKLELVIRGKNLFACLEPDKRFHPYFKFYSNVHDVFVMGSYDALVLLIKNAQDVEWAMEVTSKLDVPTAVVMPALWNAYPIELLKRCSIIYLYGNQLDFADMRLNIGDNHAVAIVFYEEEFANQDQFMVMNMSSKGIRLALFDRNIPEPVPLYDEVICLKLP